MSLTSKQERFVHEYLLDMNAKQAAIRAGYADSTACKKAALWVGKSRLFCPENMRHVWDAVQSAKQARNERLQVDSDYVLKRLVEMAECSIKQAFDEHGNKLPLSQIPEPLAARITDFNNLRVISMLDLLKAIGDHVHVNAFRQNVNMNASIDVAETLIKARQRKRVQINAQQPKATDSEDD